LKLAFEGVFDAQFAVANVQLNAKGAAIDSLVTVKKGSASDKLLAANPAKDLENLTLLPAGFPVYLGFAMDNQDWMTQWLKANYGDDPKNQEALDKALKQMLAAGGKSTVLGYSLPKDDKTGIVAVTIEDAKDADKLLKGRRDYMKAMEKMETPFFTQSMDVKENAEKYKGHSIDLVSMTMKLGDNEVAAIMGGLFKRMFGGETLQTRMAKVENLLVQASGNNPSVIRKLLDSFESGEGYVGLNAQFGKTRDQLDESGNLQVLIDLPRLIVDGVSMVRDLEPFSEGLKFAPFNFGADPPASYSGFSLGTQPQALKIKLFVPVQQPKGMIQIFGPSL
jgi:hypothetical protein